jgi:glucosamine kinase
MKSFIIGESGGTKTDWRIVQDGSVISDFKTESYHPNNWNDSFWDRIKFFWDKKALYEMEIILYSAGCHSISNKNTLSSKLTQIGFKRNSVHSDLLAAANSTMKSKGVAAIMGTGSVLFGFENNQICWIKGGEGYRLGDEGSGYYFGKLVFTDFVKGRLTSNQKEDFIQNCPDFISANIDLIDDRSRISEIALLLSVSKEFQTYHKTNIELFLTKEFGQITNETIDLIGSYGYYNSSLIMEVFAVKNIVIDQFIERPIDRLVEYTVALSD